MLTHPAGGTNTCAPILTPPVPTGMECQSLTVLHHLDDGGVTVPLAQTDQLHRAIIGMSDVLHHSLARQIESGVGDLDRRKKVRTILARTLWGMNTDRKGDVRVVVYSNRNTLTVFFSIERQWSVCQNVSLIWDGRNGVALSAVDCQTIIKVPDPLRNRCAAWFTRERIRLENHFAKRLAPAGSGAAQ